MLHCIINVAGVPTVNGFTAVAVILAVASIPAAIDPAVADNLAALTDISGVPVAASVTDNCRYRRLGCFWYTGCCLPSYCFLNVAGSLLMLVSLQCCYSVYVVAGILAVTDVPSVVVFPYVPDVSILQYCRRTICCFSVVVGFPAASSIPAVAGMSLRLLTS